MLRRHARVPHLTPGQRAHRPARAEKVGQAVFRHLDTLVLMTVMALVPYGSLKAVSHTDGAVRSAALVALGALFGVMLSRIVEPGFRSAVAAHGRRRVRDLPNGRDWLALNVAWCDWRRIPTTTLTPTQAAPYLPMDVSRHTRVTRLRTIEMLTEMDPERIATRWTQPSERYALLRLLHFGVPPQTLATLDECGGSPADIVDLFDDVPDLTPGDLTRFVHGGFGARSHLPGRVVTGNRSDDLIGAYQRHGVKASYYAALLFTEDDIRDAETTGVSIQTLATMAALAG